MRALWLLAPDIEAKLRMKLSVWLTHPRGRSLPKTLVTRSWGFDGLTVPEVLRRVASALETPAVLDDEGEVLEPAGSLVDDVTVWVERTA